MGLHTVTLTDSQEDALHTLREEYEAEQAGRLFTIEETLARSVAERLAVVEQRLARHQAALMDAGQQLPAHVRERMTEGLTPAQLNRLEHVRPTRGREREGRNPEGKERDR